VRDAALAPMRELHKLIQQPVNLSMRQGDEIVYVERAYSERSGMQVVRAIGGRAPLHLTSTGKLFLALDDPQRVRAYATRTGLAGHTRNSITQLPVLERELAKARQYGIARDNEELELGVRCMAAGIYDDQSKLVAGLSISAPADRLDEGWLPKLQATAQEISLALGYTKDAGQPCECVEKTRNPADRRPRRNKRGLAWTAGSPGVGNPVQAGPPPNCAHARHHPAAELARGIQKHHDELAPRDVGLHHQALARLGDVAGLLQADIPLRVLTSPLVLLYCRVRLPTATS
jgi:hypothetical protein